jgi:hypothetical protein
MIDSQYDFVNQDEVKRKFNHSTKKRQNDFDSDSEYHSENYTSSEDEEESGDIPDIQVIYR